MQTDQPKKHIEQLNEILPIKIKEDLEETLIMGLHFVVHDFNESNRIREQLIELGIKVGVEEKRIELLNDSTKSVIGGQ